uniref:HSP21.9 n=1 Tax=Nilaparvata lugens TaxID=108931 RepID=A0A6C0VAB7_NILLU|nr:HSP21.9 [Nilaparvata lugens]
MSLLPYLFEELVDELQSPTIYDQHFGLGLRNDDLRRPSRRLLAAPLHCGYIRPWRHVNSADSGVSTIQDDKTNFKVNLDVQQFKPEEISVKLSGDNLIIEGKHEERKDNHGYISRQFSRRYKLPENVDLQKLESKLSSDGVLTLVAPKKVKAIKGERAIPIIKTNQPALKQTAHDKPAGEQAAQDKMET